MTYCICCDLKLSSKNYTPFKDKIKEYESWWCFSDSTWFIISDQAATQIRDTLTHHIDINDDLLVFSVGESWAGAGFSDQRYRWLRENI